MALDTIHIEITYDAPVNKVWEALTLQESVKEWYFDIPDFNVRKGAVFEFDKSGFNDVFLHRLQILDVVDKSLLRYSWSYPHHSKGTSMVTWELIPRGNITSLRLTHEGLHHHQDGGERFSIDRFDASWQELLGKSLSNYLERSN